MSPGHSAPCLSHCVGSRAVSGRDRRRQTDSTGVWTAGGREPRWSRDGRQLFYLTADGRVMTVPMQTAPTLAVGKPSVVFTPRGRTWRNFELTADGRFMAIAAPAVQRVAVERGAQPDGRPRTIASSFEEGGVGDRDGERALCELPQCPNPAYRVTRFCTVKLQVVADRDAAASSSTGSNWHCSGPPSFAHECRRRMPRRSVAKRRGGGPDPVC